MTAMKERDDDAVAAAVAEKVDSSTSQVLHGTLPDNLEDTDFIVVLGREVVDCASSAGLRVAFLIW